MLTIKDIPREAIDALEKAFYANDKIKALRDKYNNLYMTGHYTQAMQVDKRIRDLLHQCKQNYVDDYNKSKETLALSTAGLPQEDLEKVTTLIMTMFVCCDLLESCQRDIEQTLHKTDASMQFQMFLGIRDIAKEVKKKIHYLLDDTNYMSTNYWGDVCDNMYKMMTNKARSILRKLGDLPSK